jgi:protein tyrosine kinase modulator
MLLKQSQYRSPTALEEPQDGLNIQRYLAILKRRFLFLLIPFVLVLGAGAVFVMLKKPMYLAEGKILVESQQIPTDLVRPTVTATANERIQTIEQRIMARDNLLAIVEKFKLFNDRRNRLSATQLLDTMRARTRFSTFNLNTRGRGSTIALTIGFEYEQPETAMRVANELITLILSEDARNRASRAEETTNFLAQEVKRLEERIGSIDAQIAEAKRTHITPTDMENTSMQIALTLAELQEKTSVFSNQHPEVIRLNRKLDALKKVATNSAQAQAGIEALGNQRASIQRDLDRTGEKLTAARLGENLERGQYSERLDVLEQAIAPQQPFKPNRRKLLALVFAAALFAGGGCIVLMEMLDDTIKDKKDVYQFAAPSLIQAVPYIATQKEIAQQRLRIVLAIAMSAAMAVAALMAAHLYVRPLDQLLRAVVSRLVG